jgi:hypothetical protein
MGVGEHVIFSGRCSFRQSLQHTIRRVAEKLNVDLGPDGVGKVVESAADPLPACQAPMILWKRNWTT